MKKISFAVLAAIYSVAALAQDGGGTNVDVNLGAEGGGSGSSYWMWIVGAIVLIVLLVVLMRGRGGSNTVVEKRTVIKD